MKRIAVITGASSGMGRKFAELSAEFSAFDEVWAIARRADRLDELKESVPFAVRPLPMDLSDPGSLERYGKLLEEESPDVALLVNCSGYGKFGAFEEIPADQSENMVDLNCRAVVALCSRTLPYMHEGAKIINIASEAAFQPVPYIGVYAATKSFVLSFSRALNRELKGRGITVTAVCPYWTKTEFFGRATEDGKDGVVKKYVVMYDAEKIVRRAYRDAKKGKDVSQYGFVARGQALLCKILPHSFVMGCWQRQQKLK